jgi:hydrogenase-4 component H
MAKPKVRELGEAFRALIKGPYTTKYPFKPPHISKNFRGKPEFNEKGCIGCGACTFVCPPSALSFSDKVINNSYLREIQLDLSKCIFCGQCELNCITKNGIHLTQEFDLSTFNKEDLLRFIQKKLVVCEICGSIIAPEDQIKWIAEKIGSAAFSNPTLMLSYLKDLNLVDEKALTEGEPFRQRHSRIRILCPNCRRETTLEIYYH